MRRMLAGAMVVAACMQVAVAQTQPAGTAATQPDAGRWRAALDQLASEDFAQRSAGQKALDAATWRDREMLNSLAAAARDPEVKERLLTRVAAIDEETALNPPPISLDLDNATFPEMATSLGKEIGRTMDTFNDHGTQRYTVHLREKPFMEVFQALTQQGPMRAQGSRLVQQGDGFQRGGVITGPVLVVPTSLSYQRFRNLQQDHAGGPTLTFAYAIAVDPRVRVTAYRQPAISSAVDDRGQDLVKNVPTGGDGATANYQRSQWMFDFSQALDPASAEGAKSVSVKGSWTLTVEVGRRSVEVPDMEKNGKTPIDLGDRKISYSQFNLHPGGNGNISESCTVSYTANPPRESRFVEVELYDATGRLINADQVGGGQGGSFGGPITPPIRGVFSVPTKSREVTLPFELKDLPLP